MPADPINQHLSFFENWDFNLPLPTQWIVLFLGFPNIIQQSIASFEGLVDGDWNLNGATFARLTRSEYQLSPTVGCAFVQNVTVPGDNFAPEVADFDNHGGFLPGILGGQRTDNSTRNLQISFRETNLDFVDLVVRPWIIATSHLGLVARADLENIKCPHVQIINFTRRIPGVGPNRPVRKIYNFYGCAPFALEAKTLNYSPDFDLDDITHSTQWVYDNYTVETSFTG